MDDTSREIAAAAARMLCVGFDGFVPNADIFDLIDRGVGGIILFSRNVQSIGQLAELTAHLKRRANGRPLMISIDHEGGRVMRMREGFTPIPTMRTLGQTGDESLAREIGGVMARELRAVNIDLNFAPVLDVDTNPANPVIADRSFGRDAALVSRMGAAVIGGLQSNGVGACGKHFPGHGDTLLDSHLTLPTLPHSMKRLREIELPPFERAMAADVASIMTAHVIFEALESKTPATMSGRAIGGLLRNTLAYDGVVISDDLEMKAIADHFGVEDAIVRGANAGVDLFLVCHHAEVQRRAIDALAQAIARGVVAMERVRDAIRRIDALASKYVRPPVEPGSTRVIGCSAHRAVVAQFGAAAVGRDPTVHT